MKTLINKLYSSTVFYHLLNMTITVAVVALFSTYWAEVVFWLIAASTVLGLVIQRVPLYISHYAPKEDLDCIVKEGFLPPTAETRHTDIPTNLLGQEKQDKVSFVIGKARPVIDMRHHTDNRLITQDDAISIWTWNAKPFISTCTTSFLSIHTHHGNIVEATLDREFVNRKILAGEFTRGNPTKKQHWSYVIAFMGILLLPRRMSLKLVVDSLKFNNTSLIIK